MLIFLAAAGLLLITILTVVARRDRRDALTRWHDATAVADRWARHDGDAPPAAHPWCRVINDEPVASSAPNGSPASPARAA